MWEVEMSPEAVVVIAMRSEAVPEDREITAVQALEPAAVAVARACDLPGAELVAVVVAGDGGRFFLSEGNET